jgi:hypothetical protein
VGTPAVVVAGVLAKRSAQVSFADDEQAVGDLAPHGPDEPVRVGVRLRAARWILHAVIPASARTASTVAANLAGSIADQNLELVGAFAEVQEKVAWHVEWSRARRGWR